MPIFLMGGAKKGVWFKYQLIASTFRNEVAQDTRSLVDFEDPIGSFDSGGNGDYVTDL